MTMSHALDGLMMDYPLTLTHFFERSRRLFAKKTIATRIPGRPLFRHTYADFAERTTRLAGALRTLGLRKGDRVATFAWNSHRHLEIYWRSEEHTSELQSHSDLVCRLLLEKKKEQEQQLTLRQ